jgi:hypothetical protein
MERPRTKHDETENVALIVDSVSMNDKSTSVSRRPVKPTRSVQSVPSGDVTGEALLLALSVLQIYRAWHAGVMSADAAMECLHREVGKTIDWCKESTRKDLLGRADRPQSHETPMRHGTSCS